MFALIRELVRPFTGWLIIVFVAMLIETAMSLASPWPLKLSSIVCWAPIPCRIGCEGYRAATTKWVWRCWQARVWC